MNKYITQVGREVLFLEADEMEKLVNFADSKGIVLDWSEATDDDIREWFGAVMQEAERLVTKVENRA